MIAEARAALAQLPGRQLRQFQWMQIDARQIPLADASCDAVIANHMLYHVMPRRQGLAEIRRILEPGGMLFASTNSGNHLRALKGLIDQFVPEAPDAVGDSDADGTFWLEDGPPQLARFFAEVRVATQNGELRVTDPQAIVEYVLSIERAKSIVVGDSLQRLREAIDAHLRANNGAFVIGTHVGILTARRGA